MEAPSPLSLLLFRLTVVSIGASCGSGSCAGFGFFFLKEALVVGNTGIAGEGAEAGFAAETGSDVGYGISEIDSDVGVAGNGSDAGLESGAEAGSGFFIGEVAAGLVSPAFGGFLFFRVTSVQPSLALG